jgi:hypothetical protein
MRYEIRNAMAWINNRLDKAETRISETYTKELLRLLNREA